MALRSSLKFDERGSKHLLANFERTWEGIVVVGIMAKTKTINKMDAHQPERDLIMMRILKPFLDSIS